MPYSFKIMPRSEEREKLEKELEELRKQIAEYIAQDYKLSDPKILEINQQMNVITNKLMGLKKT